MVACLSWHALGSGQCVALGAACSRPTSKQHGGSCQALPSASQQGQHHSAERRSSTISMDSSMGTACATPFGQQSKHATAQQQCT